MTRASFAQQRNREDPVEKPKDADGCGYVTERYSKAGGEGGRMKTTRSTQVFSVFRSWTRFRSQLWLGGLAKLVLNLHAGISVLTNAGKGDVCDASLEPPHFGSIVALLLPLFSLPPLGSSGPKWTSETLAFDRSRDLKFRQPESRQAEPHACAFVCGLSQLCSDRHVWNTRSQTSINRDRLPIDIARIV